MQYINQDHRIPMIFSIVCAIFLLITISQTIVTIVTHHAKITTTHIQPAQPLESIANLHLFGVFSANLDNLPATTLPLKLVGTVMSLSAITPSYALITADHATKVYKIGDNLPGDAKITYIAKQFVIIDDNGVSEKLALPIRVRLRYDVTKQALKVRLSEPRA